MSLASQKQRPEYPRKIYNTKVLKWMCIFSCYRDIDRKLVMLFVTNLVKRLAVKESVHKVENKVFAYKEEDHMFGHFN